MAIINSTVMGKTKGKIGNVVTTVLKGQVIAKSRNYHPANPKSVGQVDSRTKMSNAVKAWQFLSVFLVHINALRKSTESNYNAFVRLTKNLFTLVLAETGSMAANQLAGLSVYLSNWAHVTDIFLYGSTYGVHFATNGIEFEAGSYARVIVYDAQSGENVIENILITSQMWDEGVVTTTITEMSGSIQCTYLYNQSSKKITNIQF